MNLGLNDTSAWVLGASSGLGEAIAHALLDEGAVVAVSARPGPRLEQSAANMARKGKVVKVPLDLTQPDSLTVAHREVTDLIGEVKVGVFNGGGPPPATVGELGVEGLDEGYRLLLRPAYEFLDLLTPAMTSGGGVLLFCTSTAALEPLPRLAASNVMRAGVTALVKTAARELGAHGVRVLCLAPGRFATQRVEQLDFDAAARQGISVDEIASARQTEIALGRYGDPGEFGRLAAFLCSPMASYLTGSTVVVDGGKSRGLLV